MLKVFLMRAYRDLNVMLIEEIPGSKNVRVVRPLEFEERPYFGYSAEPSLRIDQEEGQHIMDQLWQQGYRPSSGVSSTGEAEAQKSHISDLRQIVGWLLGPPPRE